MSTDAQIQVISHLDRLSTAKRSREWPSNIALLIPPPILTTDRTSPCRARGLHPVDPVARHVDRPRRPSARPDRDDAGLDDELPLAGRRLDRGQARGVSGGRRGRRRGPEVQPATDFPLVSDSGRPRRRPQLLRHVQLCPFPHGQLPRRRQRHGSPPDHRRALHLHDRPVLLRASRSSSSYRCDPC
jgi:hypothetical protein